MRRLRLAALAGLSLLVACKEPVPPVPRTWPLTFTFVAPYDAQVDVPTSSRVWLRATEALTDAKVHEVIALVTDTGEAVPFDVKLSEDQQAAVLAPRSPLQPGRIYQVVFVPDPAHTADKTLSSFVTRPSGTRSKDGFQVRTFMPMDVPDLSVWPFSTFRVLLSEPVRPDSVFGGGVQLIRLSTGAAVAAEVLVHGRTITLDPVDDLVPGERYRLALTGDLVDLAGEHLTPTSMDFPVRTIAPMKQLSLALGPTPVGDGGTPRSRLESVAPNTLELKSSLAGASTLTMSGALDAALPDPGLIGSRLPMVIRKGQVLTVRGPDNGGLEIRLGGGIDTTLNSGALSMTLITDASGEISENPLRPDAPGARPLVRLSMDAALTAEDATVNSMLTQNLLGLQLVGSLYVQEGGRLGVELVGGVELDLLGLDTAASWVTIGAWSAAKAASTPPPPMTVRVMGPANGETGVDLDWPMAVVFSQPPDSSARTSVWLERYPGDGVRGSSDDVPTSMVVDGAMVLLRSQAPLDLASQYTVRVAAGVRSASGAVLPSRWVSSFTTRAIDPTLSKPTVVGSVRPGMPCAFFDGGVTKQCSAESPPLGQIMLASDLPVEAHFSKPVDPASIQLGQTVQVMDVAAGTPVSGRLKTGMDWLQFVPEAPWQEGRAYSLRLGGGTDAGCGSICDMAGLAVNTDLLLDHTPEAAGGPPIVLPFVGASPAGQGGLTLRIRPAADTNANGLLDPSESARLENSVTMRHPDGGVVLDRTYLSGSLLSEIGRYNAATGELPLTIDQGSWLYGTSARAFVTTDRLIIMPAGQQVGAVRAPPPNDPDQRPILAVPMQAYMHSVVVQVEEALQREPLQLSLEGRLGFTPDGRMEAVMSNTNTALLSLLDAQVHVLISPGDVQVKASSGLLGR